MQPIRIFIGFDPAESVAFHTLCHSIWKHTSVPVSITPLALSSLKAVHNRPRDPLQSNDFAFTRFLVPFLCGYEGYALFMDCDMLVVDDIAKLWDKKSYDYAVQVVKHVHRPAEALKYLGTVQTQYERKNWSSVMLFNCAKCLDLTPGYINTAPGLELHQFKWVEEDDWIGELPLRWNYLVGYYPVVDAKNVSNLHYTEGGPYFDAYKDTAFAAEWFAAYDDMVHCAESSLKREAG